MPVNRILGMHLPMKNAYWIVIGAMVGFGAGLLFGFDYALAGAGIGVIGGGAIMFAMRDR